MAWHKDENKLDFGPQTTWPKTFNLRPTDDSSQTIFFSCSKKPGKATGTVRDWTHVRSRARRKSKWTTGGYGALRRCGCSRSGKGTQFHCVKFRLGSAGEPTICSHCYDVLNEGYKLKKIAITSNFARNITRDTLWSCLIIYANMKWIQPEL